MTNGASVFWHICQHDRTTLLKNGLLVITPLYRLVVRYSQDAQTNATTEVQLRFENQRITSGTLNLPELINGEPQRVADTRRGCRQSSDHLSSSCRPFGWLR